MYFLRSGRLAKDAVETLSDLMHCNYTRLTRYCTMVFSSVVFCSVVFCSVVFCTVLFCIVIFSYCLNRHGICHGCADIIRAIFFFIEVKFCCEYKLYVVNSWPHSLTHSFSKRSWTNRPMTRLLELLWAD